MSCKPKLCPYGDQNEYGKRTKQKYKMFNNIKGKKEVIPLRQERNIQECFVWCNVRLYAFQT